MAGEGRDGRGGGRAGQGADTREAGAGQSKRALRRAAWVLGAVILLLAPLVGRVAVDGRAELRRAEAAAEAGEREAELRHLGRAARFRLPLAGHDERALARLRELAVEAEEKAEEEDDELARALAAWRELRRALIGTRVIGVRDPELLAEANARIVELMVREARVRDRPIERERWARELEEELPSRGRTLLAALAFVAWITACLGFFARGIDGKGRLIPRPALRWGASVILSLVAWILLM